MARAWTRGSAVVGGKVMYFSPSQVVKADERSDGGCLRKWFYRYVMRLPDPSTFAQDLGVACHGEIESHLTRGTPLVRPQVLAVQRFIPSLGPDLLVEHSIDDGLLSLNGRPVVGYTDLMHRRPEVGAEHERPDDGVTAEVIDWKFGGSYRYCATPTTLGLYIPMTIYASYMAAKFSDLERVRISHVYSLTKGAADSKKVSIVLDREQLARRWQYTESVTGLMDAAAKETDEEKIPGNLRSCGSYGGCPYKRRCSTARNAALAPFGGLTTTTEETTMGLIDSLNITATTPAPAPAPAVAVTLTLDNEVAKARAVLEAAEAAAKAAQAPAPTVPDAFTEAANIIEAAGQGWPPLGGEAAQLRARMNGTEIGAHSGLAGYGVFSAIRVLTTAADVIGLAAEVKSRPATIAPIPPDAPASNPALAADPTPAQVAAAAPAVPGVAPGALAVAAQAVAPKKRGRPKGVSAAPAAGEAPASADGEITVYADCMPIGEAPADLHAYCDAMAAAVAGPTGSPDIRFPPQGASTEFGKWKGALAAWVRTHPPGGGEYLALTRGDEIASVVVDALRSIGARVVRGFGS